MLTLALVGDLAAAGVLVLDLAIVYLRLELGLIRATWKTSVRLLR